jgi:hypothetical protein
MPQNFIERDREQAFLMAPSLVDWLAADHLAWFVVQAVGELELDAFVLCLLSAGWAWSCGV